MKALGIDPGTRRAGYAIIEERGGKVILLEAGLLQTENVDEQEVLLQLSKKTKELCDNWQPDVVGIERLYFAKNQKTALAVAQGRGAILAAITSGATKIIELSPNEVKLQIAGHGHADKKSIAKMVKLILGISELSLIDDAIDAIAIALTALRQRRLHT